MTTRYEIDVNGKDAPATTDPVNGKNGSPLSPKEANGRPGKQSQGISHKCVQQAGCGLPGNEGCGAPHGQNGANGGDCLSITIECSEFSGDTLTLGNIGGTGADGQDGGTGGKGSDGGNAGKQPKACKEVKDGGVGGKAGAGGDAGDPGNGGNAGAVTIIYGPKITNAPVAATTQGGAAGKAGQPGVQGDPGKGGLGSDGKAAKDGDTALPGKASTVQPTPGDNGSTSIQTDSNRPDYYLKIQVVTPTGT